MRVRLGIIGAGGMGGSHANCILSGEIPSCVLGAVCEVSETVLARFPATAGFTEAEGMFGRGLVDAVLIATPHFSHVSLGIAAFAHGLTLPIDPSEYIALLDELIASSPQNPWHREATQDPGLSLSRVR